MKLITVIIASIITLLFAAPAVATGHAKQPAKITRKNGTLKRPVYVRGRINSNGTYIRGHHVNE